MEIIFENDKVRVAYLANHHLLYTYKKSGARLVSCEPQPNLQTAKEAFKTPITAEPGNNHLLTTLPD